MEGGEFTPQSLELDELAQHNDPLGRLAGVFRGMAAEIYDRELRLRRAIQTARGSLMVIAAGVFWGIAPALSRLASEHGSDPIGLAIAVNIVSGIICIAVAVHRGAFPKLQWADLRFFLIWSVINGVLTRVTLMFAAEHVEASMLALIATLQSFGVFAFAAMTRTERPTPRRLFGLLLGLVGVGIVLVTRFEPSEASSRIWIFLSLALPLLYAIEWMVLESKLPRRIDTVASVGIMMLLSAVMIVPIALISGGSLMFGPTTPALTFIVIVMGVCGGATTVLCLITLCSTGAVFASLSSYAMTIAGIIWGLLLLNEHLSTTAWVSVALVICGLYFVGPKAGDERVTLNRSFLDQKTKQT
ncbi:MAG: DMT family transporter [Pseudomonadota bacterium]